MDVAFQIRSSSPCGPFSTTTAFSEVSPFTFHIPLPPVPTVHSLSSARGNRDIWSAAWFPAAASLATVLAAVPPTVTLLAIEPDVAVIAPVMAALVAVKTPDSVTLNGAVALLANVSPAQNLTSSPAVTVDARPIESAASAM